jgi:hypothetical protein
MENKIIRVFVFVCVLITFIIPLIQLSIGFQYVVKDGQSATEECSLAPDLPLLMAIGGIFTLFFLGAAYGFLKMLSSINIEQSDIAGRMPRILVGRLFNLSIQFQYKYYSGFISFIFGSITFIFFILIQIRVYEAYSNDIQYDIRSAINYCQPIVMRGALILIILTYINFLLFIGIYIVVLVHAYYIRHQRHYQEFQMETIDKNIRF